jgi:protocatechuate 3,4-dioxygenase beta subunit
LTGQSYRQGEQWWATTTVTVVDENWNPVDGAKVKGSWSRAFTAQQSCTTDSTGQCDLTTGLINVSQKDLTFIVDEIEHPVLAFYPNRNINPDGDPMGRSLKLKVPKNDLLPDDGSMPGATLPTLHVGDLDGVAHPNRTEWSTTVTITVLDAGQNPVAYAKVSGAWTYWQTASCTTDSNGQCSLTSAEYDKTQAQVISFMVDNITHDAFTHDATANSDPDNDSDGTTISVHEPGPTPMSVVDLDQVSSTNQTKWRTTVTISVLDATGLPVDGAAISGSWSYGKTANCTTDANGRCNLVSDEVDGAQVSTISFTVNNLTHPQPLVYAYAASYNSDPDGDSNGTVIAVVKPVPTPMFVTDLGQVSSTNQAKWRTTVTVSVLNANQQAVPQATVSGSWSYGKTANCTTDANGRCSLASDEVDGTQVGTISFTVNNLTHPQPLVYAYAAAHNSDPDGDSNGILISVNKPAPAAIAVADLDGTSVQADSDEWTATVTISLRDAGGQPVAAAKVYGAWANGQAQNCTTGSNGQCSVTSSKFKNAEVNAVTFSVDNVTHSEVLLYSYEAGANADPEGDSNGTMISVNQPS